MTSPLNARSAVASLLGAARSRRGATVAALVAFALLVAGLSQFGHHGNPGASRVISVPLPQAAPHSSAPATPSPAASASRPPVASPTQGSPGDDGPGSDSNPASNTGGFTQATITSGEVDPALAAVNWLVRYLNTTNMPPQAWRGRVKVDDTNLPLVTSAFATQIDSVDPSRVPAGVIDQRTAHSVPVGDFQVAVTVNLIFDQFHPQRVVDVITVTLDGSSHRWLAAQLEDTKPGGST